MDNTESYLLLDIGNTQFKAAVFQGENLMEKEIFNKEDENQLYSWFENKDFKAALISSSGKSASKEVLTRLYPKIWISDLHYKDAEGIKWSYDNPENMGKDRVASIKGAIELFKNENICVVQLGTCMTIDFIDIDKNHKGGIISPGMSMRFKAMHQYTENLPLSSESELLGRFGTSTLSCLASGVLMGMKAEIEYHYSEFIKEVKGGVKLVLTGGDVNYLSHRINTYNFVAPDLVFIGMKSILKNKI